MFLWHARGLELHAIRINGNWIQNAVDDKDVSTFNMFVVKTWNHPISDLERPQRRSSNLLISQAVHQAAESERELFKVTQLVRIDLLLGPMSEDL